MFPLPVRADEYRDGVEKLHADALAQARMLVARGQNVREILAAVETHYPMLPPPPSDYVLTKELSPVLEVYTPTLHALETLLIDTVRAAVAAQIRLMVARTTIQLSRQMQTPRLKELWARLKAPSPNDVERWGAAAARDKTGAYEIALDVAAARQQLDAALLADLVVRVGMPEKGTVAEWLTARMQDVTETDGNWETAKNEFDRVMQILVEKSFLETALSTEYDQLLAVVIDELHFRWRTKIVGATSTTDLQKKMEPVFVTTLLRIDEIANSYITQVPQFTAADRVPAVPAARDSSELFRTQHGAAIGPLVAALRPIIPRQISSLQFVKTLPPNLGAPALTTSSIWVPLSPVQAWMQKYGTTDTAAAFAALPL